MPPARAKNLFQSEVSAPLLVSSWVIRDSQAGSVRPGRVPRPLAKANAGVASRRPISSPLKMAMSEMSLAGVSRIA
ncbi:hypothetical protein D3C87_1771710 [compost metagenome]